MNTKKAYYYFKHLIRFNDNPDEGAGSLDIDQEVYCHTWQWTPARQNALRRALWISDVYDPDTERDLNWEAWFQIYC